MFKSKRHRRHPHLELLEDRRLLTTSVATFEDLGLAPGSFDNNAGPSGRFVDAGDSFNNRYDSTYQSWSGWAISSTTDRTTPGYTNQYSAITGSGANGSQTYAVAYTSDSAANPFHPADSFVNLPAGASPLSVQVTNTTYDYLSMLNGDSFENKFGPGDFFELTIDGYSGAEGTGTKIGEVDFYLANFLGSNAYIINTWQTVDLSSLAGARSLQFGLESSMNDPTFGMNTPAYVAVDNLTAGTTAASNGTVSGVVFNDLNDDGVQDDGEAGLQGWVVQLYNGSTLVATSSLTDSNGDYSISGVASGTYTLREVLKAGYSQTAPSAPGTDSVTITNGGNVTSDNFGDILPVLTGVSVTPVSPSIARGLTEQFEATGSYSDHVNRDITSQVTWASENIAVATISTNGAASTFGVGGSNITATLGGLSGSTLLKVGAPALVSIAIIPGNPFLSDGNSQQLAATGTYTDNSTQNLTSQVRWSSITPSVATVTTAGLSTGVATGTSTISALLNGITGSTVLTVSATTSPVTITSFRVEKVKIGVEPQGNKTPALVVQFSGALGTTAAQNLAAYTDFSGKIKKSGKVTEIVYSKVVPLTRAIYNSTGNTVILLARGKPSLPRLEQLQVNVSLLTDPLGRPINNGKNLTASTSSNGV